jgi:hypothetical protein
MREAVKQAAIVALGVALAACAAGSNVDAPAGGTGGSADAGAGGGGAGGGDTTGSTTTKPTTTSTSSAGGGGAGGATTTSTTGKGDALPEGAVSFFQGPSCPDGWGAYAAANGRFVVPLVGDDPAGTTHGKELANGEDRKHTHGVSATFHLGSVSYAGVVGGGNHGVGAAGDVTFSATSSEASTGLPYVQLLTCRKVSPPAVKKTLPSGMLMFFDTPACPSGWKRAQTQGRLIIGLPKGAPADLSFGGDPLEPGETRTHAHATSIALATSSHGIALASGCCGGGYAENGTYESKDDTAAGDAALPTIELLQCEKQ